MKKENQLFIWYNYDRGNLDILFHAVVQCIDNEFNYLLSVIFYNSNVRKLLLNLFTVILLFFVAVFFLFHYTHIYVLIMRYLLSSVFIVVGRS